MASINFYPTSINEGHDLSGASTRLVALSSNDSDTSYIYHKVSKTKDDSTSKTTVAGFSGSFGAYVRINSIVPHIIAKITSTSNMDKRQLTFNFKPNHLESTSVSKDLSTSYTDFNATYNANTANGNDQTAYFNHNIYTDISALNSELHILTTLSASKKDQTAEARITSAYITVNYTVVTPATVSGVKDSHISNLTYPTANVAVGDSITYTATPDAHYHIAGWYDANGKLLQSGGNTYTVTATANTYVSVVSAINTHQVALGNNPSYGNVVINNQAVTKIQNIAYNQVVTFAWTGDAYFYGWYSDNTFNSTSLLSTNPTYSFTMPDSNYTVYAYVGNRERKKLLIGCSHIIDVYPYRFHGNAKYSSGGTRYAMKQSVGVSWSMPYAAGGTPPTDSSVEWQSTTQPKYPTLPTGFYNANLTGTVNGAVYAIQKNFRYRSAFQYGVSFHFLKNAEQLPDNAEIERVEGKVAIATASTDVYSNQKLYAGTMNYIDAHNDAANAHPQPDETPVVNPIDGGMSLTVNAIPQDYVLTKEHMGTWSAIDIKNGKCGIEFDYEHNGAGENQIHFYRAYLEVYYFEQPTSVITLTSNDNCDVYVVPASIGATDDAHINLYDNSLQAVTGTQVRLIARPHPGYRISAIGSNTTPTISSDYSANIVVTASGNATYNVTTRAAATPVTITKKVEFGEGNNNYDAYIYKNNTWSAIESGQSGGGMQFDMQLDSGIYALVGLGLSTKASIGFTNGSNTTKGQARLKSSMRTPLFPNSNAHPRALKLACTTGRGEASATAIVHIKENPLQPNNTITPFFGSHYLDNYRSSVIDGVLTNVITQDAWVHNIKSTDDIGFEFYDDAPSMSKAVGVNYSYWTFTYEKFTINYNRATNNTNGLLSHKVTGGSTWHDTTGNTDTLAYAFEGDTLTFNATTLPDVSVAYYLDENCTQPYKTNVASNYDANTNTYTKSVSGTFNENATIYVQATTDKQIYNINVIKGADSISQSGIRSVSTNQNIMTAGNDVKVTAVISDTNVYEFDGWYLQDGTLISHNLSTSYTVNNNTTLIAKAKMKLYNLTFVASANTGLTITNTRNNEIGYVERGASTTLTCWYNDNISLTAVELDEGYYGVSSYNSSYHTITNNQFAVRQADTITVSEFMKPYNIFNIFMDNNHMTSSANVNLEHVLNNQSLQLTLMPEPDTQLLGYYIKNYNDNTTGAVTLKQDIVNNTITTTGFNAQSATAPDKYAIFVISNKIEPTIFIGKASVKYDITELSRKE